MQTRALIYCRVSSERQVNEGNGLSSQEQRCRNYAQGKKYQVVAVFRDEGVSGSKLDRPAINNLLQYIDDRPTENFVVVIDDLSRLARGVMVHFKLRLELKKRNVELECLNFNLNDSEESELLEVIMAGTNQYNRKANRRQVVQKMKARLDDGFWPFCPPSGLEFYKDKERGKVLRRHEPEATIYKTAIEQYRDKLLLTIDDVVMFINRQYCSRGINKTISRSGAREVLNKALYAGYIEYKPWDVSLREGKHKGFISIETYKAVQERFKGKEKTNIRQDYNLDFPLRNLVLCSSCGKPLTASWNKGRTKKYPNYWCKTVGCELQYKTIAKSKLESEFEKLLVGRKLDTAVSKLASEVFNDVWEQNKELDSQRQAERVGKLQEVCRTIESCKQRILNTKNEQLVPVYEGQLSDLLQKQKALESGQLEQRFTKEEFGTASKAVLSVLENPLMMWKSDNFLDKRNIFYMYFEQKMRFNRESGFGTASLAYPVQLISEYGQDKNALVEMPGLNRGLRKHIKNFYKRSPYLSFILT